MHLSHIRFLRRASLAVIFVVVAAVGFNYVQTWRMRGRVVQQAAKILSPELMRSADSIEYSEHENGVVRFKLRAERLLETRHGLNILEGIEAFDFYPDGTPRNRIHSHRAEYDRNGKLAHFYDDVRIAASNGVTLRTNSLHYDRRADAGWSEDEAFIEAQQGSGAARGFRYEHSIGTLELFDSVDFSIRRPVRAPDGSARTDKLRIRSRKGHYSGETRLLQFADSARLESPQGDLAGDLIAVQFNAERTKVTSLACVGSALYRSQLPGEVRVLRGDRLDFAVGEASEALERIDIAGNAAFVSELREASQELRGSEIHVFLDPVQGLVLSVTSRRQVSFLFRKSGGETLVRAENLDCSFGTGTGQLENVQVWDQARLTTKSDEGSAAEELQAEEIRIEFRASDGQAAPEYLRAARSVQWKSAGRPTGPDGSPGTTRTLASSLLEMRYAPDGGFLESGSASGGVAISEAANLQPATGGPERLLRADQVRFGFFGHDNRLRSLDAEGNVRLTTLEPPRPDAGSGRQETETLSRRLSAQFREEDGAPESIVQWGGVTFKDRTRAATAGRSEYRAVGNVVVLSESPRIVDPDGATTGETVEYRRQEGVLTVRGRVRSIIRGRGQGGAGLLASGSSSSGTVVTADMMQFRTESSEARYSGQVQLLSESSQLQLDTLEVHEGGERIDGSGNVRHLILRAENLTGQGASRGQDKPGDRKQPPPASNVLIRSARFSYHGNDGTVHYSGDVVLTSGEIVMRSDALDATFDREEGKVQKAVATGRLEIRQGERTVRGEAAEYLPDFGRFIVTGRPAEMVDVARGRSTARRLTFDTSNDRILLENR